MMRNGLKVLLICALLATLVPTVQTRNQTARAATVVTNCKCGKASCRNCRPRRIRTRCRKCPKCQHDVCQLSAECVKEERICFEVEQKLICIPTISLPWRKCEKPCNKDCACRCRNRCGKSKTVNVLSTKVYECPTCKYTWQVCEPPLPTYGDDLPEEQPPFEQEPALESTDDSAEENRKLYDPSGSDVPTPPVTNRQNN